MIQAFVFLITRSFVNRTKARLKRLKQPKYLVGALFGLLYLYGYFFRFLFGGARAPASAFAFDPLLLETIGLTILFLLMAGAWIFPHARSALVFSEAEVAFLFPAPISRRTLIHFKLLRSQMAILFTTILLTLITGRFFVGQHPWMRMLGWWVILSMLNLHVLGASFTRTLLLERGISNWLRRAIVLTLLAVLVVGTMMWARQTLPGPALDQLNTLDAWRDYLGQLLRTPPLRYLLFPFQLVLAPYFATRPLEFFKALLPALGLIAMHYFWVVRGNVAFEEASLDLSRRTAERIALVRQGRGLNAPPTKAKTAPFRLRPLGFAPVAFLWKNLIQVQAIFRVRTIFFILLPIIITGVMIGRDAARSGSLLVVALVLTLMLFGWSLLLGAQMVRCDLRQDLNSMDVLKLFPLRGWQIVAGEVAAPVVILSVVQWLLLILLASLLLAAGTTAGWAQIPKTWILAAALLVPFWNALALLIPNATALLFPGWFQMRPDGPQGFEVAGQRLLLMFGQLIVISLTLLPAGLLFAVGFVPLQWAGAITLAPLVGAVGAALALACEIVLGVWLVGKLFDRFDLAAEQT